MSNSNINLYTEGKEEEVRRELLEEQAEFESEVPCKTHPDAPHGFNRNASHSLGRYVCDCEGWEEDES